MILYLKSSLENPSINTTYLYGIEVTPSDTIKKLLQILTQEVTRLNQESPENQLFKRDLDLLKASRIQLRLGSYKILQPSQNLSDYGINEDYHDVKITLQHYPNNSCFFNSQRGPILPENVRASAPFPKF